MSLATSFLDPAVTVAALGLVGGVVSYFWRGSAERRRINRAVLGEIRRLLIAIKEHQHWYEAKVPPADRAHYPLIPFSYTVYKKQLNNVGTLDRQLVAKAVQFYGYVDFLNTLQNLRKEHRPSDFDHIYISSLDRCVSEFFAKFNEDFEKRGIDRPECPTPSTRESTRENQHARIKMFKSIVKSFAGLLPLFVAAGLLAQSAADKSSLDTQLLAAAKQDDTATVKSVLKQGANIEAVDNNYGYTPLIFAALGGHTETLNLLLSHGAKLEAASKYGFTALMLAAQNGHTDTVKALISKHADVEATSSDGATALMSAAAGGHTDTVELLLDNGARPDTAEQDGATALIRGSGSNLETVKLLLDRGAKVDSKDKFGKSALFVAAAWGKLDIVKLLIERSADPTARSSDGKTVLDWAAPSCSKDVVAFLREKGAKFEAGGNRDQQFVLAAQSGQTDIVKQLLDQGANPGGVTGAAGTPLTLAASCGQTETVGLLLARGTNIDSTDQYKNTPVARAAQAGHADTVALLLKKHANIELKNNYDNTALMGAAESRGDTADAIKVLLEKGANIDARDNYRYSALLLAAAYGNAVNVVQLLDRHANMEAENNFGETALACAAEQGRGDVVKLLLDRGAKINGGTKGGALSHAVDHSSGPDVTEEQLAVFELLLDRGADIDTGGPGHSSVLLTAAASGKTRVVKMMLDRHADINAKGGYQGDSALIAAARAGGTDTVQLLLANGAEVNAANKDGATALTEAAAAGHLEVVRLLLGARASVQALGRSGRPALSEAAQNGRDEVAKLLLDGGASIEIRDKCDWTPLLNAVSGKHLSTVRLLLDRGANLQVTLASPHCGWGLNNAMALEIACSDGSTDIARLLVDRGAPVDAASLFSAVDKDNKDLIGLLLGKNGSVELRGRDDETALIFAARTGHTEMVKLLLDRGANIDARDKAGYTALMRAASPYGGNHYDATKLLLDRGADPAITSNDGQTALTLAAQAADYCTSCKSNSQFQQILALLRNVRHTPRQEFEEEVAQLAQKPDDMTLLDIVIKFAAEAAPAPAVPETARQAFVEGTTLMRQGHVQEAREKFVSAIKVAPWWADAYYNDAIADEKLGWYDDASKQLEKYLRFSLSESDSRDARDRMYAIAAEKEAHKKDQEQYLREAAVKYVSGGAQRVDENDAPSTWKSKNGCAVECLYAYRQNTIYIDHYYQNVFRMPNGHYLAIVLQGALSSDGGYLGDRVLVAEITDGRQWAGEYSFGSLNEQFHPGSGSTYKVSVSERRANGVVSVMETQSGAGVTIPLSDLYSARYVNAFYTWRTDYQKLNDKTYNIVPEGGRTVASALFFSDKLDYGNADSLSLMPSYVVALDQRDHPIGNTGYFIRWHGTSWEVEK